MVLLLYDGFCGFCNRLVLWILARDRRGTLTFAPLHGPTGQAVLARHAGLAGVDSLVFVERFGEPGETVSVRSDAALRVASYLGAPWAWVGAFRFVSRLLRDVAYDVFARLRYPLFGRLEACPLPPAEHRARFID